jgi:hypothetical protein
MRSRAEARGVLGALRHGGRQHVVSAAANSPPRLIQLSRGVLDNDPLPQRPERTYQPRLPYCFLLPQVTL